MSADDNMPENLSSGFAEYMTDLMHARGASFRTLASEVNADPGYLNHLAKGRRAPGQKMAALLDQALDAGGELVRLARGGKRTVVPAQPGPVDASTIRATTAHLVALDTLQGSDGLVPFAIKAFRSAADRLAIAGGGADVRSVVADLGAAAAWITADAVERDQSRAIALEALAQADLAADTRLHRFLLSHLSMVEEHAGRYAGALAYADRLMAEDHDNPRVHAMVEIRRARALSGLGDIPAALDAWDHAKHLLTESPAADDGLTYWIHDAEMTLHRAIIMSRAGNRAALEWAHRSIELLPSEQGRDQVLWRAMLLEEAVKAHAWREVPVIVAELMPYSGQPSSARVPEVLARCWAAVSGQRVPRGARDAVRTAYDAFRA